MIESSGNVFADLGFPPDEVTLLTMRSDLIAQLRWLIERKGWTETRAASELGISRPRVHALAHGKLDAFSLEMLLMLATRARLQPKLTLEPAEVRP
jgi:predicted XRE-type DNA-binding protein